MNTPRVSRGLQTARPGATGGGLVSRLCPAALHGPPYVVAGRASTPATSCAALVQALGREDTKPERVQAESRSHGPGRSCWQPLASAQGSGPGRGSSGPRGPGVSPRLLFVAEEQGRGVSPAAPRPPGRPLPPTAPPTHHPLTRPQRPPIRLPATRAATGHEGRWVQGSGVKPAGPEEDRTGNRPRPRTLAVYSRCQPTGA